MQLNPSQILALIASAGAGLVLTRLAQDRRHALTLDLFEALEGPDLPSLSIVVAARDEEQELERALSSLLCLDYPNLEIVLVNDRSTDQTQEIAERLRNEHPQGQRLQIIECQELPEGWLGKVHAQHLGALKTQNEHILFTDADVCFTPESLALAVTAQKVLRVDHLVVAPRIETHGFWEKSLVGYFFTLFNLHYRPSRVHIDETRFVGVGAFNLLTRSSLQELRYLEPLRMQVADDIHLGRMIKGSGLRQACLLGGEQVSVRWFRGLWGAVVGLEKNAYAGLEYQFFYAIAAGIASGGPGFLLLLSLATSSWGLATAIMGLSLAMGLLVHKSFKLPLAIGLSFPLASLVLAFTILRSTFLAELRGSIRWRDTRYSLKELRAAHRAFVKEECLS